MFTALCVMSTFICSSWGGWKLPSTDAIQKACDSDSLGIKVENLGYFALDNKSAAVMMEKLLIVVLFVFLVE